MIAAWCLGGGGGPKASGGGETATSSHFLPHFETFFLAANLPCFPTSCPTKARGRPVNESINGEPPTSLPVKVRNCLFSSFCLFHFLSLSPVGCRLCALPVGDNCGAGLIPRLGKAAASLHQGSVAGPQLSNTIIDHLLFSTGTPRFERAHNTYCLHGKTLK